ncbi:UDP-N-acetylglucosamine 2-epimerase [Paenibacillus polymyxa]|uniref:UDP-N-acetylglucosamine 2-epimerase n=1 Tax=Paenibacillus TaxID=44249 RepID=UPI00077C4A4E|nr:UDP-N-acetylglucosamine 2-epimerase [Paenibacillus polymyxa]AOK90133.1 UDP-N-acetyl-D-glucosamine 2-epimerase, UDP-hydrolysing [Paenibacillus polymyxa]KYG94901.1 UDP-N-acetyl glucosamine 2-epimerase [Paenibacillus polymyxa]
MKKVLVITGTRADYGIYYPVLRALEEEHALELHLLVTGMHLSPQHGYTLDAIQKDGFRVSAKVDCLLQGSTHANMSRSIGIAIMGMTQAVEALEPDFVVVLGDRGEMLAAAIVSSHMNIPLVHLHGGEVSGTIDESVRHAISKLAHIHFVATNGSRERLIRLGEEPWRIHVVGAPRIETMMNTSLPELGRTKRKYDLNIDNEYVLFAYHPVTTEEADMHILGKMMEVLLAGENEVICVMPNSDAGADAIVDVYNRFAARKGMHLVTSFEQLDYLTMLKNAKMLIGNSSSGIIEAASFHVPVINIGTRQTGRERSVNTIDIAADELELISAMEYAMSEPFQQIVKAADNIYSRDNTSSRIVDILNRTSKSEQLIQKTITY